jgi:hypothetical protein
MSARIGPVLARLGFDWQDTLGVFRIKGNAATALA